MLLAGLEWAIEQGYDVVNLSLSMSQGQFVERLHELADRAYFKNTLIVAAAHNMPVAELPVALPGGGLRRQPLRHRPARVLREPDPPVEFLACGVDVELAWLEHSTIRATGNSFATPHIAGLAALALCPSTPG